MGEEVKAVIPESLLKKNKRNEEWELAKKQELEAAKKKKVENRKLIFNRAKQYAKEYEAQVVFYLDLCKIRFYLILNASESLICHSNFGSFFPKPYWRI
ncbi:hypothetical protein Gorai_013896 [Gossypium raimondii]|uniref:Large ribosomal subunit protein uL30 N-terminal eukaryotes domain-containing protein n=1 Tax=Gossypium raimondii TaxID=29730 RepID=A0A7J8P198_GOSRA|nr:hypothetical protein [Gossypium raimondii]